MFLSLTFQELRTKEENNKTSYWFNFEYQRIYTALYVVKVIFGYFASKYTCLSGKL